MDRVYWPYFDPEYENLSLRINPPRVSIDNTTCAGYTLVKVDSVNKPGILLEVVQVFTELDLAISKAYISSDGGWFMDVFHVTDQQGNKVTDPKTIDYIEKVLGPKGHTLAKDGAKALQGSKSVGANCIGDHTAIELIGRDRPGLLSEITAILTNLHINVLAAEVWTHNKRIACVLYVNDDTTCRAVEDPERLSSIEEQLNNILGGPTNDGKVAYTKISVGLTHIGRRLHQMMFADRDYEVQSQLEDCDTPSFQPVITVEHCEDKGYSVVNVQCKDRSNLLFDIVCTLTDMEYVVFHASISSDGPYAHQEYYIRHMDGSPVNTEGEKARVIKCLEAAIRRRVCEGLSLELSARDKVGLLSEVTRILRESGLSVSRADVTTVGEKAKNVFYVRDASGNPVDMNTIEGLRKEIGQTMMLNVKKVPNSSKAPESKKRGKPNFFFGGLLEKLLA